MIKALKNSIDKCRFLLMMSYLTTLLLVVLNLYILYKICQNFIGDGWSFFGGLILSFLFIITIPALIFSVKNTRYIIEGKKYKCIFSMIISIMGILIGLVLHNATCLWIYILSFSILLLFSCFVCKKKTKINSSNISTLLLTISLTILLLAISLLGIPNYLLAQTNNKMQGIYLLDNNNVFYPYIEFVSTDITDMFNPEKSSKYPSTNLFDGCFNTCWVAGSYKKKNLNTLYVKLPKEIDLDNIILNIFSGYGKSKTLYYQNARPKRIKISIYAAYNPKGHNTEVADKYFIKKYSVKFIKIKDTLGVQSFPLNLNKQKLFDFQKKNLSEAKSYTKSIGDENSGIKIADASFIIKIEILDIYQGIKYDDVCISEIFFNNRFVTPYPLKFNKVKNVYIKNDNTLLADFTNKKGVVIYKDKSSIFTMVDWNKNENFAILHYIPNEKVGAKSRTEEYYSLVDLKNRNIADKEFLRFTGCSPLFGIIEKKEDKIFIGNLGEFNIELK